MWTEATDVYIRSGSGILFEDKSFAKRWHCPWGSNVVDDLAPEFKRILEENFSSSSMHHLEDTKDNRSLWWAQRNSLDKRLSKFLRYVFSISKCFIHFFSRHPKVVTVHLGFVSSAVV